jgi:hypothetical protein
MSKLSEIQLPAKAWSDNHDFDQSPFITVWMDHADLKDDKEKPITIQADLSPKSDKIRGVIWIQLSQLEAKALAATLNHLANQTI